MGFKKMKYILFERSIVVALAIWGRVCMLSRFSHIRLFANPWMVSSSLGSSVHGILQARILEWAAIAFSRGSSWPRDRTLVSHVSCIGRWVLYHWAIGKPPQPFPSHVCEGAWVPGVDTGQQDPPSLDPHWPIKYSPSHVTQTMTLHVYEVKHSVLQSQPPHFTCSVASCGQVPWC